MNRFAATSLGALAVSIVLTAGGAAAASTVPPQPVVPTSPAGGTVDPAATADAIELSDSELVALGDELGVLVGVVGSTTEFDTALADAVAARVEELGFNAESVDDGDDPAQQRQAVDDLLAAGVNTIAVVGPGDDSLGASVAEATNQGVLVVHVVGPDEESVGAVTVRVDADDAASAATAGTVAADGFALWLAGGIVPGTIEVHAASEGAAEAPAVSEAPTEGPVMPAIPCGTDLQDAQDLVQEAGVFLSLSEDATGQDRMQIIDSSWTVVGQRPEPGTPISEGDPVFLVVKDEEFTGC